MRKFFEEPTLEMTFFDAENVVITESAAGEKTAKEKAVAGLTEAGIDETQIIALTF